MAAAGAVAQGGLSAFGNAFEGETANNMAQYNAKVAEQNAALTREASVEEARRSRVMARKVIGDARANYAASGIGLTGSALDILGESAANAELDALTIEHNGENKARMFGAESRNLRLYGKAQRTGAYLGASGQLLSSAGKAYGASGGSYQAPSSNGRYA